MISLQLAGMIPVVGGLIALANALAIFRESRKGFHGDVADTIVVRPAEPRGAQPMTQDAYRPPQAELVEPSSGAPGELAARGTRFWAALIDGLISAAVFVPVLWLLGAFEGFPNVQPLSVSMTALTGLLGLGLSVALNGWLVANRGQTIGKAALGIKIVRSDGSPLDFQRWLVMRVLPLSAVGLVPVANQILPLVDMLFIFRSDRRCIHDLIADTIVVRAR